MTIHHVEFKDGTVLDINDNERYLEEQLDNIIERALSGKKTPDGIPIVPTSTISFYVIKDLAKASAEGREQKKKSDQMAGIIIKGALDTKKPPFPFIMATTMHGGGHYQGLIILFKENKHVEVTAVSSIEKTSTMSPQEAQAQLEEELYILKDMGFIVDRWAYKEHYLQPKDNDCGRCTVANLLYECDHLGENTKASRLTPAEALKLRANQAYQHQMGKNPPGIFRINGKKVAEKIEPQKAILTSAKPAQALSLDKQLAKQLVKILRLPKIKAKEFAQLSIALETRSLEDHVAFVLNATTNANNPETALKRIKSSLVAKNLEDVLKVDEIQAQTLSDLSLSIQDRSAEDHVAFIVTEFRNSDGDAKKLIKRLSADTRCQRPEK